MSDLISRSELLEEIKSLSIALNGKQIFSDDAKDTVLRIINEQPTAYSVDKVIEELDKSSDYYECEEQGREHVQMVDLTEAIEIVKQGGVDDDVCEWKYTKEIMDNTEFKVGCNTNALKRGVVPNNFSYHDFKYCPYCGKKIKVMELCMERLTKRIFVPKEERELVVFTQGKYIDTIPAEMTHEDIRKVLRKLAEYEDFEEKLNGVSVKQVVDGFIKTVENQTNEEYERGRILTNAEADEWNEYKQLDEQGLLLRLPCKVGDKLYYPNGHFNIVIPVRLNEIVMSFVGLDTYSFQYNCCSFDECGDAYEDYEFDLNDISKTVFLTKAEAEQKLKEMESKKRI